MDGLLNDDVIMGDLVTVSAQSELLHVIVPTFQAGVEERGLRFSNYQTVRLPVHVFVKLSANVKVVVDLVLKGEIRGKNCELTFTVLG